MNPLIIVGLVWKVIRFVINEPIINKALDNWTNGTSNQIDNEVWALIEKLAGSHDAEKIKEEVMVEVARMQEEYSKLNPERKAALKKQHVTWAGLEGVNLRNLMRGVEGVA